MLGLVDGASLNGKHGIVARWDEGKERFEVSVNVTEFIEFLSIPT